MKKTLIALALTVGATFQRLAQDIVDTAVKAGSFKDTGGRGAGGWSGHQGPGRSRCCATGEAFAKIPRPLDGPAGGLTKGCTGAPRC